AAARGISTIFKTRRGGFQTRWLGIASRAGCAPPNHHHRPVASSQMALASASWTLMVLAAPPSTTTTTTLMVTATTRRRLLSSGTTAAAATAGRTPTPTLMRTNLRRALAGDTCVEMPCAHDGLSARLIVEAGFPSLFVSGYG